MIAFRLSGTGGDGVTSDCRTPVEEWGSMALQLGGFAACIALARAMVRLPCPVPASNISKGCGRGEGSLGCRGGVT